MEENNQPILSICIPTYNRRYSLQYTLESIITQDEFKSGYVEIVISDNVSTDETEVEVKKLCKIYKNIRYSKNEKNIGGNPNFMKALSLGEGKFSWLFGSDDIMTPNALKNIINCISNYNPKVVYSRRGDVEFVNNTDSYINGDKIMSFNGVPEFIDYLGNTNELSFNDKDVIFTFMSVLCVNTDYFRCSYNKFVNNLLKTEDFNLSSFNFNIVALGSIKDSDIICVIVDPINVLCKPNSVGWAPNKKISQDLRLLTKYLINNYKISYKGRIFFRKLNFSWYLGCESKIYHIMIGILKKLKLYESLGKLWRKYFLGGK